MKQTNWIIVIKILIATLMIVLDVKKENLPIILLKSHSQDIRFIMVINNQETQ